MSRKISQRMQLWHFAQKEDLKGQRKRATRTQRARGRKKRTAIIRVHTLTLRKLRKTTARITTKKPARITINIHKPISPPIKRRGPSPLFLGQQNKPFCQPIIIENYYPPESGRITPGNPRARSDTSETGRKQSTNGEQHNPKKPIQGGRKKRKHQQAKEHTRGNEKREAA